MEGVLHWGALRGRNGERPLPAASGLEGFRKVSQPQDVGWCDELRAHSVLVQSRDAGTRAGRVEPSSRGRISGHPEPVQGRGARLPERVLVVNRLPTPGLSFYRACDFRGYGVVSWA